MNLKFYLGKIQSSNEVKVAVNSSFIETQDDSFNSGTFELQFSTIKNEIAPMTPFYIKDLDDDSEDNTICFVVVNDNVTIVKKTKPTMYLHTLTVTQNLEKYTKFIIRNSSFSRSESDEKPQATTTMTGTRKLNCSNTGSSFDPIISAIYTKNPLNITQYYSYQRYFQIKSNKQNVNYLRLSWNSISRYFSGGNVSQPSLGASYESIGLTVKDTLYLADIRLARYTKSGDTFTRTDYINFVIGNSVNNKNEIYYRNRTRINEMLSNRDQNTYYRLEVIYFINGVEFRSDASFYDGNAAFLNKNNVYPTLDTFSVSLHLPATYSLYEILSLLLKQAKKEYNGQEKYTDEDLFTLPNSGEDYETLINTEAPTFSFTQKDLYSCVAETLNYIDAIPTIDSNGMLHIEYLNNYSNEKANIEITDIQSNLNEQYHTNRLIAEYQQARQSNPIHYPIKHGYRRACGTQYGIIQKNEYIFPVGHKIDFVDELKFNSTQGEMDDPISITGAITFTHDVSDITDLHNVSYNIRNFSDLVKELDMTPVLFEEKIYGLLPFSDPSSYFPNRYSCLWFTQGDDKIHTGTIESNSVGISYDTLSYAISWALNINLGYGYSYMAYASGTYIETWWSPIDLFDYTLIDRTKLQYNVKFHALLDGKVALESRENKFEGETPITQTNGSTQLNRMGLNMLGLISKLGNKSQTISLNLTSFDKRLKKGSLWIDDDGNRYIANKIKTTFSSTAQSIIQEVEFVKNYNELSRYIKVDNAKRFYEIDPSLVSKGYETIVEYLYFTTESIDENPGQYENIAMTNMLVDSIIGGLTNITDMVTYVSLRSYYYENDQQTIPLNVINESASVFEKSVYVPSHFYGFGNMLCFECGFENPLNAGDRMKTNNTSINSVSTLYTDTNGSAEMFDVFFTKENDNQTYYCGDNFPLHSNVNDERKMISINKFKYFKRPNEIFHLNYEIALLPYHSEEIFFGDTFIVYNGAFDNLINKIGSLAFYTDSNEDYSIIDKKAHGTSQQYSITIQPTNNYLIAKIVITLNSSLAFKNWCFADQDKNILICGNFKESETRASLEITVFASRERI